MDLELGFAVRPLTFQLKFCCSCALMYDGETQDGHDVQCYKEICSVNINST